MTILLNLAEMKAEALLNALASFCRIHGAPRCYQNWSPETLRDYLAFHIGQQTFAWISQPMPAAPGLTQILGTGVAWQCDEAEIRRRDAAGQHIFDWLPTDPASDSVFFADFVCDRGARVALLLEWFAATHPDWKRLKWFTYRRNKLIRLTRRHVAVVLRKAHR